jgi:homeobox protein ESX1
MPDSNDKPPPPPAPAKPPPKPPEMPKEIGGAPGPEPTRYGDWQHKGRVTDF